MADLYAPLVFIFSSFASVFYRYFWPRQRGGVARCRGGVVVVLLAPVSQSIFNLAVHFGKLETIIKSGSRSERSLGQPLTLAREIAAVLSLISTAGRLTASRRGSIVQKNRESREKKIVGSSFVGVQLRGETRDNNAGRSAREKFIIRICREFEKPSRLPLAACLPPSRTSAHERTPIFCSRNFRERSRRVARAGGGFA